MILSWICVLLLVAQLLRLLRATSRYCLCTVIFLPVVGVVVHNLLLSWQWTAVGFVLDEALVESRLICIVRQRRLGISRLLNYILLIVNCFLLLNIHGFCAHVVIVQLMLSWLLDRTVMMVSMSLASVNLLLLVMLLLFIDYLFDFILGLFLLSLLV